MLFTKNLYTAIKLVHFWPFWTLFPYYFQFIFILHQIQFDLVDKFQLVISHECKVIHKEFIYSNQIGSFLTFWTLFPIIFNFIHIAPNSIRYTLTTIYYPSCSQISNVIHKEFIHSNQIGSFLTILDTISKLSSIYIHIAPNSIIYTLTTIHYPSAQQISGCYNLRVQCYSQRIYIQQSNWFIFNHFGHYFQIIFNLYSYCTKFNSIHINYNILSILLTNFSML